VISQALLISVMPSRANIEVIRLGDLSPVEIAKIAVPNDLETSI